MIYEYICRSCDHSFDVVKSVKHMEDPEACPSCGADSRRIPFSSKVQFIGTKVQEAEYNPGLGTVVKNAQHRKELAKAKGLIELGNDKPDPEKMAKERAAQRQKEWDKL